MERFRGRGSEPGKKTGGLSSLSLRRGSEQRTTGWIGGRDRPRKRGWVPGSGKQFGEVIDGFGVETAANRGSAIIDLVL